MQLLLLTSTKELSPQAKVFLRLNGDDNDDDNDDDEYDDREAGWYEMFDEADDEDNDDLSLYAYSLEAASACEKSLLSFPSRMEYSYPEDYQARPPVKKPLDNRNAKKEAQSTHGGTERTVSLRSFQDSVTVEHDNLETEKTLRQVTTTEATLDASEAKRVSWDETLILYTEVAIDASVDASKPPATVAKKGFWSKLHSSSSKSSAQARSEHVNDQDDVEQALPKRSGTSKKWRLPWKLLFFGRGRKKMASDDSTTQPSSFVNAADDDDKKRQPQPSGNVGSMRSRTSTTVKQRTRKVRSRRFMAATRDPIVTKSARREQDRSSSASPSKKTKDQEIYQVRSRRELADKWQRWEKPRGTLIEI